ncbi:MAG: hypothetical protein V4754_13655 [Pseudomonadota bacterium]
MHSPSAAELLDWWEDAAGAGPVRRALALLALAFPEPGMAALAALPIGRRDGMLMELREHLFGPRLDLGAACPHCRTQLESSMALADLRAPEAGAPLDAAGYRIAFRLPASDDLLALPPGLAPDEARDWLCARCLLEVRAPDGAPASHAALTPPVRQALARHIAEADPLADLELAFTCPACGHRWQAVFDIGNFLWRELQAWALRTLGEVHQLARAYGWSEAQVLALSPARRQRYLEWCQP